VLLFLGILLISLNFLYKQGRITSDKMEMQNAADAIAYSISLSEARDLNFAAYLNRAMVANEVAIGQLMGLASWAQLVKSYGDFFNAYVKPLEPVPIIGQIVPPIIGGVSSIFKVAGGTLEKFLAVLGNFGTSFMHISNMIYSWAQWGYHVATVFVSTGLIGELLDENAPPGTSVSNWGWMSLVTHFASYGSAGNALSRVSGGRWDDVSVLPASTPEEIQNQFSKFVQYYHPSRKVKATDYANGDKGAAEGFERFAAIVRDSRDPFTLDRSWELKPFDFMKPIIDPIPLLSVRDGNLNVDVEFSFGLCEDLGICLGVDVPLVGYVGVDGGIDFDLNFYFGIGVARDGASELRLLIPSTGKFEAGSVANWSSADTSSLAAYMGASLDFGVWIRLPLVGRLDIGGDAGFALGDEEFDFNGANVSLGPFDIPVIPSFTIPFPTSAPFGAAFTEAGKTTPNNLKTLTMTNSIVGGKVPTDAYGGAANRSIVWNLPGVPPVGFPPQGVSALPGPPIAPPGVVPRSDTMIGAFYGDQANRVNKNYPGLPGYIDTSGQEQTVFGFGAPQLTISLILDEAEHDLDRAEALVDTETAGDHPEMGHPDTAMTSGGLRLTDSMADGLIGSNPKLHTVARSEVYFKRPNDLDWFTRLDGREEKGSAFNPYWHARLTEMPYLDSVTALMLEQGEDFTGATEIISTVLGDLNGLLGPISDFLDDIGLGLLFPGGGA